MAVYLTKSMLTKLKKVEYPLYWETDQQDPSCSNGDPWRKLSDGSVNLAKDMICRVCAREGSASLSDKIEGYGIDIMSAIRSISNVNMHFDDSLPKYICFGCLDSLKVAMAFKRNCESSDRKFKHILNPNGDPSFHSYPYSKHDFQLILHQMKLKRMKIEEKREKQRKRRERIEEKRKHPRNKQFKCSPCDMVFANKPLLVAHRRERQCMRRACELCGQLVLSIAQHMRHIHKHTTAHKCPTCGKEFPVIARLRNHMLVHTNTFNFFCDLCPYKSKHKYYLVMHMRTHTGEKPYRCAECPATFVNPSNLNKHKLTHQEKQFKCAMCEKAFRTSSALREHHEATHMNIKHTCNYCGRDFCYKSDLRKHEIRSHNRSKREFIGGEPTYKQVERLQREQLEAAQEEGEKLSYQQLLQHNNTSDLRKQEIRSHNRAKRGEFIGGEPTYKQVERMQREQLEAAQQEGEKLTYQQLLAAPQQDPLAADGAVPQVLHAYSIDQKDFVHTSHPIYFSDVNGIIQQQPQQMVQQQTVQLSLPELTMKKDEVKLYETQQGIGYF